ncbi:MAG: sulfatase [Planctomycetaceae bacterium]|nr:sulfatase [Planctomycetaceae bacterium]|tara:strand:- start:5343 stop:6800 length:1458 start_codon:yes stop_codon:yes gene_type:complete
MHELLSQTRRDFLTSSSCGLGSAGLASLLAEDGLLAADPNPLATRPTHFEPRAKACIFIFMAGAPSHLDLFDPKPRLNQLHGQPMPDDKLKDVRFAFIKKDSVRLMGTKRTFRRHGECGTEFSDLLPHIGGCADDLLLVRSMHSDQFNHHPGQLLMQCGRGTFGLPTMGSWINYGLGSETRDLPGYVVLTSGRGSSGGATLWQSGFLPSVYAGVRFRTAGEPVLNLSNPSGLPPTLQRKGLDILRQVNGGRLAQQRDPEIASRIASYELAYRMQTAAPELIDLSSETKATQEMYGVNRKEIRKGGRGKSGNTYQSFARNCLLARRLVERGVRFINLVYASWDHHSNLDNELSYNTHVVDQPIAALINDLKQRGLLDQTMVVWGAEFGRTPLGENRGGRPNVTGRDHHPFSFSMFLAGGGIKGGLVHGASDEIGWGVAENPVHVNDLHATMLHSFGLDHLKLTHRFQGRDFRLTDVGGRVVTDWLT